MVLAAVFSRTSEDVVNTFFGGVVFGCVSVLVALEIVRAVHGSGSRDSSKSRAVFSQVKGL